jgi:hypothetical protein
MKVRNVLATLLLATAPLGGFLVSPKPAAACYPQAICRADGQCPTNEPGTNGWGVCVYISFLHHCAFSNPGCIG